MKDLRAKFLKTYANIPLALRDEIVLVLEDYGALTWKTAYFEVKNETTQSERILKELAELKLI